MNIGRIPAKTAMIAPNREALVDVPNARRMSFGELEERICKLGNALTLELRQG